MDLVVAVDENWGIGKSNQLLLSLPADMAFFRQITIGKTVIMGHNTYNSIEHPLKGRKNIVLTNDCELCIDDVTFYNSISELIQNTFYTTWNSQIVIGGETIYNQLLEYCTYAFVTKLFVRMNADRYFPNLDISDSWEIVEQSEIINQNLIDFQFLKYRNTNVRDCLSLMKDY